MKIKKESKSQRGITLIALVITIIVLLILAGVTIAALSGDNGILQRAAEAKEKTSEAEKQEIQDIENMESIIEEYVTGIKVEQVTDAKPGELEVDEIAENTYIINSIEDLVFFAHDVTNGNTYEGETVKLGLSLDFNSNKSYVDPLRTDYGIYGYDGELKTLLTTGDGFQTIGITTEDNNEKNLLGTFDGNNNAIINLYINVNNRDTGVSFEKRGLFANNYGIICNLKLLNVNLYLNTNNGYLAGISGQNSGIISNCFVSGEMEDEIITGVIGGITCYNSGNIENSGNAANINAKITGTNESSIGGICTSGSGQILNCYNIGSVKGTREDGTLLIGGIAGNSSGKISNCYNTGNIIGKSMEYLRIGGILGNNNGSVSQVKNCYNIGKMSADCSQELNVGMVIGRNNGGTISAIYYQKIDETRGIGAANTEDNLGIDSDMAKTDEEMKSEDFVELLNADNSDVWKQDTENKNNGYPILSWQ